LKIKSKKEDGFTVNLSSSELRPERVCAEIGESMCERRKLTVCAPVERRKLSEGFTTKNHYCIAVADVLVFPAEESLLLRRKNRGCVGVSGERIGGDGKHRFARETEDLCEDDEG
jgi:hypothetical protein